jgi:hypothetical protein
MDLQTAANLAEVLGVLIVIVGFAFAVIQLMHFRRQRRDMATIELARSFQNPEFSHAIRCVMMLPKGVSIDGLKKRGSDYENAAFLVSFTFESFGVMVHRRIVSLDMVWELMGGTILGAWERLEGWRRKRWMSNRPIASTPTGRRRRYGPGISSSALRFPQP